MADRYRVIISMRAGAELQQIFDYIESQSPQNAPATIARILAAIEGFEIFPHRKVVRGQRPGTPHPIRSVPAQPYVVFFRVIDESRVVRILQVRHGARRRPKRFD